jgi:predicted YcjX-like family ATPase
MRKLLAFLVLMIAISAVTSSQTNNRHIKRSQSEELIALSQEFVKTSIRAIAVENDGVKITPSGPMASAEVNDQREAMSIKDAKVRIDGDSAIVTGQVIFAGRAPEDKSNNSSVTIHFLKQRKQWKLVKGCFGECV